MLDVLTAVAPEVTHLLSFEKHDVVGASGRGPSLTKSAYAACPDCTRRFIASSFSAENSGATPSCSNATSIMKDSVLFA